MKRRRKADEPARFESLDAGAGGPDGDRAAAPPVDVADAGRSPADLAVNAWLGRRLRGALARLAPVDRMIVLLREMEGLSTREVADITRMSEANVKTRLHRARVSLRALLKEA
jgi:RNA polymerase sigma-70 factor (ECF subfamily)